jgi:hypothetical protein
MLITHLIKNDNFIRTELVETYFKHYKVTFALERKNQIMKTEWSEGKISLILDFGGEWSV